MKKLLRAALAATLLFHAAAWAQLDRANVSGTITDASSAVIAEVSVSIESADTGFRFSTMSNAVGAYLLPSVPIGTYTLSFSKAGFGTKRYEKMTLTVGQTRTLNFTLDVSATATQIDVSAEQEALTQNNAEIGLVVNQQQVQSLPMNGRNWSGFLMLAPGATNTGDGSQNSVRFNGRGRDENNFTFDGVDATGVKDPRQEANLRLSISLDSIAEFRVSSGLYNAESGNGAGAQMNLVSKSGTNQFHGSAFEFFRNDKLDARRPIDSTGKPPFRLNQFGANLGGPVFKDKTFFFANYEGLRQRLAITNSGTVPSEAYRARVMSTSPILRPVVEAYPLGTSRGTDPNIDLLVTVGAQPWREDSGLIKLDHRFTPATSMFVRYNVDDGLIDEQRNALRETRTSMFRTQNGIVQFQHLFGPALLMETRLGVNRSSLHRDTNGTFPEGVSISGFTGLQADRGEVEIGTSYGLIQSLTWSRGRHVFKFGGEIRKIDLVLADSGTVTTTFTSRDNFAVNKADSVTFASAQPGLKGLRPYYFGYAQDEIKLTPALTLSVGTRYEYYSVARTADGRGRVLDFQRCGGFCAAGTPWYFPDKNNFAPRAGLGWAPKRFGGNTVLRAGYGVFYAPGQIDDVNAPIDSYPETYTLSSRDNPSLAYPAIQFLPQAKSTGVSARAQQRDRRDAYAQQWTLSVQQKLPGAFVLQTAYVGSNGHKLFGRSFINTIDPLTGSRPYPTYSNVDTKWNQGNSSMQSLQVSMNRSFRSGFQWQTQYMYSHNISDNSGAGEGQNIMISNCRQCDRGDADWDVRHTLTANGIYNLPLGRGRKYASAGLAGRLLEGWNVSGLGMARTGLPFNVTVNRSTADLPDGVVTTPGKAAPPQRPDVVAGQNMYAANPSANGWLNAAAFRLPAKGTWGNLPRSALRGPDFWQTDIAAGKKTRISERHEVEFRAELFNLFNRAQYGAPNANLSNLTTFGTITSVVNSSPTGFGGPRQIQLMLRYNF
ncbi:MAG: TonB-dependent receptor [Candidatus Solibacter sp.]